MLGFGEDNEVQNVLNIQPVVPFHLNSEWNLITRTIAPIIYQPQLTMIDDDETGLGDISLSAFLSPANSDGLI